MVLIDKCDRPLFNMRVAITRRCNLHCEYCHMEGEEKCGVKPGSDMTVEEIVRIVRVALDLGISRIKLTGGEPLIREDVLDIVHGIATMDGLEDLSMTTNGILLASLAARLRSAGLNRVNVTIPTLDKQVYHEVTGGQLDKVLEGVNAAIRAGFSPVKINMLILRGINDKSVPDMIEYARKTRTILQLIELENVNITDAYYVAHNMPLDTYEEMLKGKALRVETRRFMQNRRIYDLRDVSVEVIRPTENAEFCMHCTRLRLTSDGKLKPCLMLKDNLVDILTQLRRGASDAELVELFKEANDKRQPYNVETLKIT
jgi:cyclic pyranopterin phosphate synthase